MQSSVQTQYKIDSPNPNFMGWRLWRILRPFSICLIIFYIIFFPDSRSLCKMQSSVQTQYKIDSPNPNFMGSKRLRRILRPFSICLRIFFNYFFPWFSITVQKCSQACKLSIKLTHQILILWARRDLDVYCVLSRFVWEFWQLRNGDIQRHWHRRWQLYGRQPNAQW